MKVTALFKENGKIIALFHQSAEPDAPKLSFAPAEGRRSGVLEVPPGVTASEASPVAQSRSRGPQQRYSEAHRAFRVELDAFNRQNSPMWFARYCRTKGTKRTGAMSVVEIVPSARFAKTRSS